MPKESRGGKAAKTGGDRLTGEAREAYDIEMSNADDFAGAFVLESNTTQSAIGYQMYVHKDVTGRSLIADTQREVDELKRAYQTANSDGKSYGMSDAAIKGMKMGIQEKIRMRENAISKMMSAKSEYERYSGEARVGAAKAKRRGGKWM